MEIVDIVDGALELDESLRYLQARACERRVTDEALRALLRELAAEAVVELGDAYLSHK
jgi:hypothetical protein